MSNFRSPFKPVEKGSLWCVFDQRGVWEWLVHPDDAARYIAEGIVVDGDRYAAARIDDFPHLNAVQIRAMKLDRGSEFIEAVAA